MATNDELSAMLAHELAQMDGMDEDGLFELRWSGGTCPEPLGDAWNMDYLPKGERLAAVVEQQEAALEKKGVVLADLALVIENDEQTRLAIDSATAVRVYAAAGISEVGKQIIAARAGATQIHIGSQAAAAGK